MVRNEEKDKVNSFPYTSKTHSTLKEKKFIPLYAEDLHFSITRAGQLVTHMYEDYTFEQSKFKKDFLIMNQNSRQKATSSLETLLNYLITVILELTAEISLSTAFWNLFTMTSLKYSTLKSSQQFSMMTHLETFFTSTIDGRNNPDISIQNICT